MRNLKKKAKNRTESVQKFLLLRWFSFAPMAAGKALGLLLFQTMTEFNVRDSWPGTLRAPDIRKLLRDRSPRSLHPVSLNPSA